MKFIDHTDPTKSLDKELDSITLDRQYSSLTDREKLLVFAKIHGYYMIPPSIQQLISDDYFLGSKDFFDSGNVVFDFWKNDFFPAVFPSPVLTSKPYLILSGAIGIGKSTVSRICLAETYARLVCMRNPSITLGLAPKPLSAVIFHRSEDTAVIEFKRWFERDVMRLSPFFRDTRNDNLNFKIITSGPRGSGGLGSDVIFFIMGEINFWDNQENARSRLQTALGRFKSRFSNESLELAGQFIVDSSAKGNSDCTEWFLENTDPRRTWNCKPAHYEVRPEMYRESRGRTFKVFTGNGKYPPQIIPIDHKPDPTLDPDKIIEVPMQLLADYKANIIKSLQDFSGVSTGSSDKFFESLEHMINCSTLVNRIPEVITVDFYDKSDRLIEKIEPMIKLLPMNTPLWVGLDLSAARGGDMTGIAAVMFNGWEDHGGTRLPKVKCPFVLAIKNKDGQEISLFHIFQLIQDLHKRFNIVVSADQAFSRQILQDCDREGIKNYGRISTDLVPCEPAIYLKTLINLELIQLPEHKRLQREAHDLYYTDKGKVDHPKKASISKEFDNPEGKEKGSKDVWDALSQACYSLKKSIDEGEEYGTNAGVHMTLESMTRITKDPKEESGKIFQNMLQNLF